MNEDRNNNNNKSVKYSSVQNDNKISINDDGEEIFGSLDNYCNNGKHDGNDRYQRLEKSKPVCNNNNCNID